MIAILSKPAGITGFVECLRLSDNCWGRFLLRTGKGNFSFPLYAAKRDTETTILVLVSAPFAYLKITLFSPNET